MKTIGRYEVQRRHGRDALHSMYLGHDPALGRLVTLDVFDGDASDDAYRARFMTAARSMARAQHRNVAVVFDVGEHQGRPFMAMEYIAGDTLRDLLRRSPPPALSRRLSLIEALCAGLEAAHTLGLVHRACSPSNLLIDPDGDLKMAFGIQSVAFSLVAEGMLAGPVNYLSPEQVVGSGIDHRSDIFAAGAILYEAITLQQAFPGTVDSGVLLRIVNDGPLPIATHVPDIDRELVQIVERALHRDAESRYQNADDMRRDLARVRRRLVADEQGQAPEDPQTAPSPISSAARSERDTYRPRPGVIEAQWPGPESVGPPAGPAGIAETEPRPMSLDDVQFTVYRPRTVRPDTPAPMVVYTHLGDRPDTPPGVPTPIEQVRDRASRKLGTQLAQFRSTTEDAKIAIPLDSEISLVPQVLGIEFTPERHVFRWVSDVHEHSFAMTARAGMDGRIARGRLAAYLGVLLVAEVDLSIRVDSSFAVQITPPSERVSAKAYRKIFASYSRRDTGIVEQVEHYVQALGDRYLRDIRDLRAGEKWQDGLLRLIDEADVFQLFWSSNAMRSPNVRREWEYALSLNRTSFVRPTYWEVPLPEAPEEGLPPETLRQLHFHRLGVGDLPAAESAKRPSDDDTAQLRILEVERARQRARLERAPDAAASPSEAAGVPTLVRPQPVEPPRPDPARASVEVEPQRRKLPSLGRSGYFAAAASIVLAIAVGTLVLRNGAVEPPPASEVNRPGPADVPLPPTPLPRPPETSPVPGPSPAARGNTTPPAPAVRPPAQPPTGVDADRAAIMQLLDRYTAAYRSMDDRAIRAIDPGFGGFGFTSRPVNVADLRLFDIRIALNAGEDSAVVRARRSIVYGRRADESEPRVVTDDLQWTLRKDGSGWRIVR